MYLQKRVTSELVVAVGETSGACAQAHGTRQMQIGVQIDPGVPWCQAATEVLDTCDSKVAIYIALKSGNFGSDDFFIKAFEMQSKEPSQRIQRAR